MKTRILAFAILIGCVVFGSPTFAQTNQTQCLTLTTNMRAGAKDAYTNGEVTSLQNYLADAGFFNSAYVGTGNFGPITYKAVVNFQRAHNLPTTGYVGPMTRAVIRSAHCSTPSSPVTLYYVQPTVASIGTSVSVTGFGMTDKNNLLLDGFVLARDVPITSSIAVACTTDPSCHGGIRQTITVTLPSYLSPNCPPTSMCPMYLRTLSPGIYDLAISNSNGTSNTLKLTVTDGSSDQSLSISSLDAPTTLAMGQSGTWTVSVRTTTSESLHYAVVWGDETDFGNTSAIRAPDAQTISTRATFTHNYARAGTYSPKFTVTDSQGRTISTSSTVTVTPLYIQ